MGAIFFLCGDFAEMLVILVLLSIIFVVKAQCNISF